MNNTIYVLDGYGLIYRSYFAFIHRPLTDNDGNNVSAVHGFFRTFFALVKSHKAQSVVVALDPPGPTFRHERYPEYKANRDAAPEDLHSQVPIIEEILAALEVPVFRTEGFEADDVMGSLAELCLKEGRECRLVSADKDLMQLVDGPVKLLRPEKGGGLRELGPDEVMEEKGVRPDQIVDYLALIGDSSDNIPGVAGIGPKTAATLLSQWQNLEHLYENLEGALKGARLKKLQEGRESAFFSKELVEIRRDVPIPGGLEAIAPWGGHGERASALFSKRNLRSLASEVKKLASEATPSASSISQEDFSLESMAFPSSKDGGAEEDDSVLESPAPLMDVQYVSLLSSEDLDAWAHKIQQAGLVALDTETNDLDPMRASLVGLSVSTQEGEAAYIPLVCPEQQGPGEELVRQWLKKLFTGNDAVQIVGQNFKYDMKVLQGFGVDVIPATFDTMLAAWVLDASSPVGMDALAERYLGMTTVKFKDVVPKKGTFADVPLADAVNYAAEDADVTLRLYHLLQSKLQEDAALWNLFQTMEMPLQPILAAMEQQGIALDIFELEAYGEELGQGVGDLVKEIHHLCGHEFNVASPKQLQKVLFEERGLTPGKKTKTGFSTDNTVLMELAKEDPVPEKILLYRSLSKLKSTYVDALPQLVLPADGRIHTSYSQTGAATGRLSSTNPNLQNIPVRDENGRRIRRAFKSKEGHCFVSADYSQIELVVLAHMSGDEALATAFREGVDVHARTAALLFGLESHEVLPEQRRMAKAVNFGVMYGMSAFRLSNELGIPRKEAKHFIDAYFATYSGIKAFVEDAVKEAEETGGVHTLYGRFRPLPGINSRNRVEKAAAERAAVNSRIQGTAADIMKRAMIDVNAGLMEVSPSSRMLLQVHDELLLEVPLSEVDAVSAFLKSTMEGTVQLNVPLRVQVENGDSWGDLH